jgi:hypothetical protein
MASNKIETTQITLDPDPKATMKTLAGADHDEWNFRLANLISHALPVSQDNKVASDQAAVAALSGMVDMRPADPIEGILIGHIVVASEAALSMYRRGWQQPSEYFEARTKYLALADKATRSVALLVDALDRHRSRGKQQITVRHITVNADQAVVADRVVAGNPATDVAAPAMLADAIEKPMEVVARHSPAEPAEAGGGGQEKQ